jgi:hypothetical protein
MGERMDAFESISRHRPAGTPPPSPQSAGAGERRGRWSCESTLEQLEGKLVASKKASASMWDAGEAITSPIMLERTSAELDATLRECTKERRMRRTADHMNAKLRARVEHLEGMLDDPRVKEALAGPVGLTLEASQALIAKLHESHEKTRACETRLKQVEQELAKTQAAALRASSIPPLQKHIAELTQELMEAQDRICALEASLKTAVYHRRHSDAASQVDTGDMFDMVDSRCRDLQRCMEQAEREKVAAEAYSIQKNAELARAQHRLSCLEKEVSAHQLDSKMTNSPQTPRGARERAQGDAQPEGEFFAKDLSACQRQLQACRKELEKARSEAQEAKGNAEEQMEFLLAQRLEQARSAWRRRESKLEDSILDLQRRGLVAEQRISETSNAKRDAERMAQQNMVLAQGYLEQLHLSKASLNVSDQKVREGETRVQSHLIMANEVMQQQVRLMRNAIRRIRASRHTCSGECQDIANRISLQVEAMRACDFSDLGSLQRLAKHSGHVDNAAHGSLSPRSPLLLDSPNLPAPSPSSSHASPTRLPEKRRSPKSSSDGDSPIVMPMPRSLSPSVVNTTGRARPADGDSRRHLDLNSTEQGQPSAPEATALRSSKDDTHKHTINNGEIFVLPGSVVLSAAGKQETGEDGSHQGSIGKFASQAQWVSCLPITPPPQPFTILSSTVGLVPVCHGWSSMSTASSLPMLALCEPGSRRRRRVTRKIFKYVYANLTLKS